MAKRKQTFLDRDAFFSNEEESLKKAICELPNGSVWVRELSGKSLLEYNNLIKEMQKDGSELTPDQALELMATLVSMTVINPDGSLMFSKEDVNRLANSGMSTLLTLSQKAMEVSGIDAEAIAGVTSNLKNVGNSASTAS